jgi:ribosomal protein S18 acetylase RimI-like enzyme
MVAHATTFSAATANPHVRQIDPWRDGRAVANLLESAFHDEIIDESGQRMIHSLRYYGAFEALTLGLGTGFVWVEGGELRGNASVQRNVTRKDTWIIGNVATSAAQRNRGIGRSVVEACINYAASRGARYIALQADASNKPALHLYEKIGFTRLGDVTHYLRPSVHLQSVETAENGAEPRPRIIRKAKWADRDEVWSLTQCAVPEKFMFAEPFDRGVYRLGLRWSLVNTLSGNVEQWLVQNDDASAQEKLIGAVRTRVNFEGSNHHLELMLSDQATYHDGVALARQALKRFDSYLSKSVYSAQPRPNDAAHAALQALGFQPTRTLAHMKLDLTN